MRPVDESGIGSAKVLPPEEFRLSWWQNFFLVRRKAGDFRRDRVRASSAGTATYKALAGVLH
jgi:hypothetical protein